MNKEWKLEDLEHLFEINDAFKEKCKHIVKIINEIYVEVTGEREPFCFEDFYIEEQKVCFNVCYADGLSRKIMRAFPCSFLTINEDSELKREILKSIIVEYVEEDELSVDKLVEIVKNIIKTRKEMDNFEEIEVLDEEQPVKKPCVDCCTDGRFEMIERVKNKLIEATNIETSEDDMKVIDNILFRFWQMDWLEMIDEKINKK